MKLVADIVEHVFRTLARRLWIVGGLLVVLGAVAVGLIVWRVGKKTDRDLAAMLDGHMGEIAVDRREGRRLDEPPPPGTLLLASTSEARDAVLLGDRLAVATGGGLLLYPASSPTSGGARRLTPLEGVGGAELTAAARLGTSLLVGDAAGGITLVDSDRAQRLHLSLPRTGAVADIVVGGEVAYLLITGVGVLAFDGRRAADVGAVAGVDLREATALCLGAGGLVIGGRDGALYAERAGKLVRLPGGIVGPVSALACPSAGETNVLIGTPFGVHRIDAANPSPAAVELRRDLFVTSILSSPAGLLVATFDDGVREIDPATGKDRRTFLAGQRIARLRLLGADDDRVVALASTGAFVLGSGAFSALPPLPGGLSGNHVTALALDGAGQIWVGTFDHGIDVLDGKLNPVRHLPERSPTEGGLRIDARDDQVNALLYRPETREMLAATVHGVNVYGGGKLARLDLGGEDRGHEGVSAVAVSGGSLALGTSRGVTLVEGTQSHTLYAFHGLANNHVYAVAAWGDRLLAGTLAGVSIIEQRGRPVVTKSVGLGPQQLRAGWVTALCIADEGAYVGTYGGGVQRLRPDGAVDDVSRGIARVHVNPGAMALDRGTLWVGTLEAGLLGLDRARQQWRRLGRWLPAEDVTAILVVGDTFYLGSTAGLLRIPRAALEGALEPVKTSEGR